MVEQQDREARAAASRVIEKIFAGNQHQTIVARNVRFGVAHQFFEIGQPLAADGETFQLRQRRSRWFTIGKIRIVEPFVRTDVERARDQE